MEPFCRRPPDYVGAHLRFLTHAFTRRHLKIAREMTLRRSFTSPAPR